MTRLPGAIMSAEWKAERNARRRRERALPRGLRADVRRVRRDDLAQTVLDTIDARLQLEARRYQLAANATVQLDVMPVVARKLLLTLDTNQEFRGFIRRQINQVLRGHHVMKIDPQAVATLPDIEHATPHPELGVLPLRSSIGLGTASYLEAEPEQWCQYVVTNALARVHPPELDEDAKLDEEKLHLLVIGAGPGGVARTVTALELPVHIHVSEYDYVLAEPTAMPCVNGPRGLGDGKYDVIVVVLPSPSAGHASNHRRIYRYGRAPEYDLSALGPRKWLSHVECWVEILPDLLAAAGEIFMLVPASVRCGTGYQEHAGLLESVLRACNTGGLEVVEQVQIVEIAPVNQPYVARRRPQRWSLRLRRNSSSDAAEVRDA